MARPRKYPPELLDRGARVVIESGRPIAHVARDLGVPAETLRRHVRRVEADEGLRRICRRRPSVRRSGRCARRSTSCGARTRSSRPRRCFSRPSSTQTDRSEPLHRRASRPLRRRADLPGPGRVGVRLLPARLRPALSAGGGGRAAARADPRAARGQLLRLRLPADVEGATAGRRAGAPLPGPAADARPRHRGGQAAWAAVADHPRPIPTPAAGPISSSAISASRRRTGCGSPTCPTCAAGRAWCSSRS